MATLDYVAFGITHRNSRGQPKHIPMIPTKTSSLRRSGRIARSGYSRLSRPCSTIVSRPVLVNDEEQMDFLRAGSACLPAIGSEGLSRTAVRSKLKTPKVSVSNGINSVDPKDLKRQTKLRKTHVRDGWLRFETNHARYWRSAAPRPFVPTLSQLASCEVSTLFKSCRQYCDGLCSMPQSYSYRTFPKANCKRHGRVRNNCTTCLDSFGPDQRKKRLDRRPPVPPLSLLLSTRGP